MMKCSRRCMFVSLLVGNAVLWFGAQSLLADEFFISKIEPLLRQRCFECHSHETQLMSGLTLDSRSGWEQGGDLGPAVVPGKPEESLLIRMVRWIDDEHQMPPEEKLPPADIAAPSKNVATSKQR